MNLLNESAAMNRTFTPSCINWQAGTDESHCRPTFTLDERGFIRECDKSAVGLFGYGQHELLWQHISCLFPRLTGFSLMRGKRLRSLRNHICHGGNEYEAINKQGAVMKFSLWFTLAKHDGTLTIRLMVRPAADSYS